MAMRALPEQHESLWLLTVSPGIWSAHFLLSYVTAAIWCAKASGASAGLDDVRLAIAIYTAAALLGIGMSAWVGWRRHRESESGSHVGTEAVMGLDTGPGDTAEDRHQFLAFSTLILSGLSAVATIYVALAPVFIGNCR
jgi:hypothetical protein